MMRYVVYVFVKMFECTSEHLVHVYVDRDTNLGYFNGVNGFLHVCFLVNSVYL